MKCGSKLAKRLHRRVAPRSFVLPERHRATLARARAVGLDGELECQGRDLVGKAAPVDGGERALMAAEGERVLFVARDLRLAGMVFRDEPGAQIDIRIA